MRFVAPSLPEIVNKNRPADDEVLQPHLLSTMEISDGSQNIRNILQQLQSAVDQNGDMQDQFGVMMNMDSQTGSLMITVVRAHKNRAQPPDANLTIMKQAIKEYQSEHSQCMNTFHQGIQDIKTRKAVCSKFVKMNRENSILNLVAESMNKLLTVEKEQQVKNRKESLSSETDDERELENKEQMTREYQQQICIGKHALSANSGQVGWSNNTVLSEQ